MSYVYLIANSKAVKIGIADDPYKRLSGLQTAHHEHLRICCTFQCENRISATRLEGLLHSRYASKRLRGEWFNLNPNAIIDDVLSEPSLRVFVIDFQIHKVKVGKVVADLVSQKAKRAYDRMPDPHGVNTFIATGAIVLFALAISLTGLISASIPMYFMALMLAIASVLVVSMAVTLAKEIYEILAE
jgi:hypothetical protein